MQRVCRVESGSWQPYGELGGSELGRREEKFERGSDAGRRKAEGTSERTRVRSIVVCTLESTFDALTSEGAGPRVRHEKASGMSTRLCARSERRGPAGDVFLRRLRAQEPRLSSSFPVQFIPSDASTRSSPSIHVPVRLPEVGARCHVCFRSRS